MFLRIAGLVHGWGWILDPPQPDAAEVWAWSLRDRLGLVLDEGGSLQSRAAAIMAANAAATQILSL